MFEIRGLDKLDSDLKAAQRAFAELDGELGTANFDPENPESIEVAIASVEKMVDDRVRRYSENPFVVPMISEMKESYRQAILDKAAEARLGGDAD
ncbi:hypothetical protein [Polymorphobacter megasporae]|uniref:hypothetical protein n=1 Tax=Glacieibacterium megasporae TaxID=2835787 RepID=UPI001C1E0C4E|nr:hypothetical protein [Polymorphobacter megasporae]UAJ10669.1 hypothetical protein KTC28_02645 [Polymorphobacter megasporae]